MYANPATVSDKLTRTRELQLVMARDRGDHNAHIMLARFVESIVRT